MNTEHTHRGMSRHAWILVIGALAILAAPSSAQYVMQKFTIDGGGGTSAGGTFALSGTAGQPDAGTLTGGTYALAGGFWFGGTGAASVEDPTPPMVVIGDTRLDPASPNPNHGETALSFNLATPRVVKIEVFNVRGERIRTILSAPQSAGLHRIVWNGADERGAEAASGIYLVRFSAGDFKRMQKIVLLR